MVGVGLVHQRRIFGEVLGRVFPPFRERLSLLVGCARLGLSQQALQALEVVATIRLFLRKRRLGLVERLLEFLELDRTLFLILLELLEALRQRSTNLAAQVIVELFVLSEIFLQQALRSATRHVELGHNVTLGRFQVLGGLAIICGGALHGLVDQAAEVLDAQEPGCHLCRDDFVPMRHMRGEPIRHG